MAVHFTGPVLNAVKTGGTREWFSNLPVCSSPEYVVYFNDFLVAQDYAATDWVVTEVGAGGTEAIAADETNGALLLTCDANDNDLVALQSLEEWAKLTVGKRVWFETKLKISDATQSDYFVGLNVTDTTLLASTDSVGFLKNDGDTNINARTGLVSTTTTDTGFDMTANTYVTLGFYWDGISSVKFFVDRALAATHTTNIPTAKLALSAHIQNGEGAAKTMTIDYLYVCQER